MIKAAAATAAARAAGAVGNKFYKGPRRETPPTAFIFNKSEFGFVQGINLRHTHKTEVIHCKSIVLSLLNLAAPMYSNRQQDF